MLAGALRDGRAELAKPRSGYGAPVEVGICARDGLLLAATPAAATLRADPQATGEREWLLVAATLAALVDLAGLGPPVPGEAAAVRAGELEGGFLVLALPGPGFEAAELRGASPRWPSRTTRPASIACAPGRWRSLPR